MAKSLLLVSRRKEDQEFAAEAATVAGLSLKTVEDPKEAAALIAADEAGTIFADVTDNADYQALEAAIHETVGLFSDRINANTIHFLSSVELQKVAFPIQSPLFGNFVVRTFGPGKDSAQQVGKRYGRLVKATLLDRAFGLTNFLEPGAKIQIVKFKNTNQKQAGVEAVKNYLLAAGFKSRMASVTANAVDEVLMNAMFDAPVDGSGRPAYTSISRNTAMALEGRNAIEMHVGFDGAQVGISVIDQFGSLDRGRLLAHVSKKYNEDAYKLKNIVAGAGIGLATIFSAGGSLVFAAENGVRTEATVMFKRTDNFREFKEQFRYLVAQFYF